MATSRAIKEWDVSGCSHDRDIMLQEIAYQLAVANEREAARDSAKQKPYKEMYNAALDSVLDAIVMQGLLPEKLTTRMSIIRSISELKKPVDPTDLKG